MFQLNTSWFLTASVRSRHESKDSNPSPSHLLPGSLYQRWEGEGRRRTSDAQQMMPVLFGKIAHSIMKTEIFTLKPINLWFMIKLFINVWCKSDLCNHISLYQRPTGILAKLHLIPWQIMQFSLLSWYLTLTLHSVYEFDRIGMQKPGLRRWGTRSLAWRLY